jgi:DNA-binding transcriptional LysR family regulator
MNCLTLEQWRACVAVVNEGGHAHAADALAKSQSAVVRGAMELLTEGKVDLAIAPEVPEGFLVIRDSGSRRETAGAWNVTQNRITFSQTSTSIEALRRGMGFGWYAETLIRPDLASGTLKLLPLAGSGERFGELYLIFRDAEGPAPGAKHLAHIIREIRRRARLDNTWNASAPPIGAPISTA